MSSGCVQPLAPAADRGSHEPPQDRGSTLRTPVHHLRRPLQPVPPRLLIPSLASSAGSVEVARRRGACARRRAARRQYGDELAAVLTAAEWRARAGRSAPVRRHLAAGTSTRCSMSSGQSSGAGRSGRAAGQAPSTTRASSTTTRSTRRASRPGSTALPCTVGCMTRPEDCSLPARKRPRHWPGTSRPSSTAPTPARPTSDRPARSGRPRVGAPARRPGRGRRLSAEYQQVQVDTRERW